MLLSDLLTPQRIKVPILGTDKRTVLSELLELVVGTGQPEFLDIFRAVEERERVLSTGIGHGVAIPHGKSQRLKELRLAAGVTPAPVAFDALDGQPVRLFFLLIGPAESTGEDVRALGRISRLVRREQVREKLLAAPDAGEFHRVLAEAERLVS
ncbi:MAG: PTS sugar transporter subunit IIA [Gemmatimonadetes bacterium]|nr:PTS sugar transporter subunit IIA [Gemmatimonadota bacterium]